MRSDEEELYVPSLRRKELARLVDFLDRVRSPPLASLGLTKRTLQVLNATPVTEDASRRRLHRLRAIFSHFTILSSSYFR